MPLYPPTEVVPGRLKAGSTVYPGIPGCEFITNGTQAIVADQVRYQGFIVDAPITIDQLTCSISATGTATLIRMAIYAANTDWQPTTLIVDGGTVSAAGAVVVAATVNVVLPPGRYLTALNADGTATLFAWRGDGTRGGTGIATAMAAGSQNSIITATLAFGAFPAAGTVFLAAGVVAGNTPPVHVMLVRVSAP
jgi:hypothetical protein